MSRVELLYEWLAADASPEVDRILAAGLVHADAPYAARIAALLLERGNTSAWGALIANYDRLGPELRAAILVRPELVRAGVSDVLRGRAPDAVPSALNLLLDHPCPLVAELVAETLRHSSPHVRDLAARVLRATAEQVFPLEPALSAGPQQAARWSVGEYHALAAGLRSGLRTFDAHHRLDVLEACLWFAPQIGSALWDMLGDRRARSGHVVTQNLTIWNGPRLAGFLLLALGQPTWRRSAARLLAGWNTRAHMLAMLGCSDLLARPGVRRSLRLMRRPAWLAAAAADLSDLPPSMRASVPAWICHLGFSDEARLRYLDRWRRSFR